MINALTPLGSQTLTSTRPKRLRKQKVDPDFCYPETKKHDNGSLDQTVTTLMPESQSSPVTITIHSPLERSSVLRPASPSLASLAMPIVVPETQDTPLPSTLQMEDIYVERASTPKAQLNWARQTNQPIAEELASSPISPHSPGRHQTPSSHMETPKDSIIFASQDTEVSDKNESDSIYGATGIPISDDTKTDQSDKVPSIITNPRMEGKYAGCDSDDDPLGSLWEKCDAIDTEKVHTNTSSTHHKGARPKTTKSKKPVKTSKQEKKSTTMEIILSVHNTLCRCMCT